MLEGFAMPSLGTLSFYLNGFLALSLVAVFAASRVREEIVVSGASKAATMTERAACDGRIQETAARINAEATTQINATIAAAEAVGPLPPSNDDAGKAARREECRRDPACRQHAELRSAKP
jgi:hypothetical protein